MLARADGSEFASGKASYLDQDPSSPGESARINVSVEFEGLTVLALVDTGAAWSVVNRDLARTLGLHDRDGLQLTLHSRYGHTEGKLVRVGATLLAEEGESVSLDATVFVSEDWTAGNFLGYSGLLERITFAIDPETSTVYYGAHSAE